LAEPQQEPRPASTPAQALATFGRDHALNPRTGLQRAGSAEPHAVRLAGALGFALAVAQAVTLVSGPTVGLLAESLVLGGFLGLSVIQGPGPQQRLTLALAILPLVSILTLAVPAAIVPPVFWYLEIGLATFEAIVLVMRRLDLTFRDVGVQRAPIPDILMTGAVGAALAVPAYVIAGPLSLGQSGGLIGFAMASAIVIVFVGILEELLFRGLIQSVGTQLMSRGGVVLSVAATALMYSASLNLRYVLFITLVAAFFGIIARRSGSIAAPIAGHAALVWVQLVILPILLS
jgi:membrane protease YdiL (CAAX protease family)